MHRCSGLAESQSAHIEAVHLRLIHVRDHRDGDSNTSTVRRDCREGEISGDYPEGRSEMGEWLLYSTVHAIQEALSRTRSLGVPRVFDLTPPTRRQRYAVYQPGASRGLRICGVHVSIETFLR